MKARHKLYTLFASCVIALAGCGGSSNESTAGGETTPPPSGTPPSGTPPSGTPPSGTPPSGTPPATLATATLQWTAPSDSRVQGYRVYYGTSSRSYAQARGAGLDSAAATTVVITDLQPGQTYYFAVTAYDSSRSESDYSSEVAKLVN